MTNSYFKKHSIIISAWRCHIKVNEQMRRCRAASAEKILNEIKLAFFKKKRPGQVANVCDYAQAYRTYVLVIAGANRHECRQRCVLAKLVEQRVLLFDRNVHTMIYF